MTLAGSMVRFQQRELVDEDGRPVAEVASRHYDPARTDVVACPYADARAGMPMNRSALRQMSSVWPELLAASAHAGGPEPTVHRAWAAVVKGMALPLAVSRPTPRPVAAWFKASLGLSQVYGSLLVGDDDVADAPLTSLGSASDFFAALDRHRWLLGAVQACAGTEAMIRQVFDATVGRLPTGPRPTWLEALEHVAEAPTWVAVHAAVLLIRARRARAGQGAHPGGDEPPWLRMCFAAPNRDPDIVRRFFPRNAVPEAVQRVLAAASGPSLEEAVRAAVGTDAATAILP